MLIIIEIFCRLHLAAASLSLPRFLGAIPVLHRKDGYKEDAWNEWLRRHSITRTDGRWLADRRDPSPFKRRAWTATSGDSNWRWSIGADDFLDALMHQSPRSGWLCVGGRWTDCHNDQIEEIHVDSAFVTSETAEALANSLRWQNPHDFSLPWYEEEEERFKSPPFELVGWLHRNRDDGGGKRLDGFDPHAREISYPPYQPGASFIDALGLTSDIEKREWLRPGTEASIISELWSEDRVSERDKPYREGARISASVAALIQLCELLKKDLIFSVKMDRKVKRYGSSSSDDFQYIPDSHKIFILSANGQLCDARQSYQVG